MHKFLLKKGEKHTFLRMKALMKIKSKLEMMPDASGEVTQEAAETQNI